MQAENGRSLFRIGIPGRRESFGTQEQDPPDATHRRFKIDKVLLSPVDNAPPTFLDAEGTCELITKAQGKVWTAVVCEAQTSQGPFSFTWLGGEQILVLPLD